MEAAGDPGVGVEGERDAGSRSQAHTREVAAGALGGAERSRAPRTPPRRVRRDQDHPARARAHGRLGGRARERHRVDRALRVGNEGHPAGGAAGRGARARAGARTGARARSRSPNRSRSPSRSPLRRTHPAWDSGRACSDAERSSPSPSLLRNRNRNPSPNPSQSPSPSRSPTPRAPRTRRARCSTKLSTRSAPHTTGRSRAAERVRICVLPSRGEQRRYRLA